MHAVHMKGNTGWPKRCLDFIISKSVMGQVAVDKVPGYKPLILEMRSAPVLVNLRASDRATPPSG